MSELKQQLIDMSACNEAVEWVGDRTLKEAWSECERGDWMIWLAGKFGLYRKLLVLAACDCAEQALKFVPDGEKRPRIAIETAQAWCKGKATIEQVRAAAGSADATSTAYAADATSAAAYTTAAAYAATYAADSAAFGADSADSADSAASAAAYAADSADSAASAAAYAASLKLSAELVRARIPYSVIEKTLEQKP